MIPRVRAVRALDDYELEIAFENGEVRRFDVKPYLDRGVFVRLREPEAFRDVSAVAGSIQWGNGLDLSYDTVYIEGRPMGPQRELDLNNGWWELQGFKDDAKFFAGLRDWLLPGSILCFQEGYPDEEILEFFVRHSILGQVHCGEVACHAPATTQVFSELSAIMNHHAAPELAMHVLVHRDGGTLLEWYDAFCEDCPIRVDISIPEDGIRWLARLFGTAYRREELDGNGCNTPESTPGS